MAALLGLFLAAGCERASHGLPACRERLAPELCGRIGDMLLVGFGGRSEGAAGSGAWADPDGARFSPESAIARDIAERNVAGVVLFGGPDRGRARNIESPAQLQQLVASLEAFSASRRSRAGLEALPLLVAIDQEGGRVDRLPRRLGFSQRTLSARTLGAHAELAARRREPAARAVALSAAYARAMAQQLRALGIRLNLAPCVDLDGGPHSPAIGALGRSFSADPEIVAAQAGAFVGAFHQEGVLAALKHFPGHGSALGDSHAGVVDVTATRRTRELLPYQRLIDGGFRDVVLVGHLVDGRLDRSQCKPGARDDPRSWCPASMSHATVTGLLRGELGFTGVIAADDLSMRAIAGEYPLDVALEKAIGAGVELLIVGNHTEHATARITDTIADLVARGRVEPERIRAASEHVRALRRRPVRPEAPLGARR